VSSNKLLWKTITKMAVCFTCGLEIRSEPTIRVVTTCPELPDTVQQLGAEPMASRTRCSAIVRSVASGTSQKITAVNAVHG
jgi:hypothetical protein